LAFVAAVEEAARLIGQARLRPIEHPAGPAADDLAVFGLAGEPIAVFLRHLAQLRIEHVDQAEPAAAVDMLAVEVDQLLEIVAQPQPQPERAGGLVALQHKAGEERRRPVPDGQRVGQAQIIFRNDIRVGQRHRMLPGQGQPSVRTACSAGA